jgi:hypothetical protein
MLRVLLVGAVLLPVGSRVAESQRPIREPVLKPLEPMPSAMATRFVTQLAGIAPGVSYLYGDVTVSGSGLSGVSQVTLDRCTNGNKVPLSASGSLAYNTTVLAQSLGPQTIISRTDGSVTFRVIKGVYYKSSLLCDVSVVGSFGVDTLHQALTVDYLPVITGVNKTKVQAGEELTFTGRNLNGPIRGFMNTTLPNSPGNPPQYHHHRLRHPGPCAGSRRLLLDGVSPDRALQFCLHQHPTIIGVAPGLLGRSRPGGGMPLGPAGVWLPE